MEVDNHLIKALFPGGGGVGGGPLNYHDASYISKPGCVFTLRAFGLA